MLRCVSRLRLRNQLRALLWLDVSLSFVPEWDTHNKLSMNSHNTFIVLSQLHQLPRPRPWAREAVDLHGQEPRKSILEMEAKGDVTQRYVPWSMCLDYGPWYNLCPSLTGIMHKSNIQSYLFPTQMHAWRCKATQWVQTLGPRERFPPLLAAVLFARTWTLYFMNPVCIKSTMSDLSCNKESGTGLTISLLPGQAHMQHVQWLKQSPDNWGNILIRLLAES